MGANAIKTMSIAFALMGITIFYCSPNSFDSVISFAPFLGIPEQTVKACLAKYHRNYIMEKKVNDKSRVGEGTKERLFTKKELLTYDGSPDSGGIYLSVLGEVFDVSKGAQHYKPGSSYAFFAGRDASRAYITGDFEETLNCDDVSDLDPKSLVSLADWLAFYHDEYNFIGRLIGLYYDEKGKPTDLLVSVKNIVEGSINNKWLEDNERRLFPPCNSEWSQENGGRVWCTSQSGGVERTWIGVPRLLQRPGKDPRCVCVRDSGPPTDKQSSVDHGVGDLEHRYLQEYPDCAPRAVMCQVDHP